MISVFLPFKQHVSGMESMQHCIARLVNNDAASNFQLQGLKEEKFKGFKNSNKNVFLNRFTLQVIKSSKNIAFSLKLIKHRGLLVFLKCSEDATNYG